MIFAPGIRLQVSFLDRVCKIGGGGGETTMEEFREALGNYVTKQINKQTLGQRGGGRKSQKKSKDRVSRQDSRSESFSAWRMASRRTGIFEGV